MFTDAAHVAGRVIDYDAAAAAVVVVLIWDQIFRLSSSDHDDGVLLKKFSQ